jgi:hypothetical protein
VRRRGYFFAKGRRKKQEKDERPTSNEKTNRKAGKLEGLKAGRPESMGERQRSEVRGQQKSEGRELLKVGSKQ